MGKYGCAGKGTFDLHYPVSSMRHLLGKTPGQIRILGRRNTWPQMLSRLWRTRKKLGKQRGQPAVSDI
jgi:hypothetical protein